MADRDAISQALVNLFQNSIKYSDHDKHVTIALSIDGEEVRILVADRGIGIPMVDQARIFDRYYRVRSGPTGPQGSGLGLSIVKHVVDAHGGRLEVQSTEAEGSTFVLILPAQGVPSPDAKANTNDVEARRKCNAPTVPESWTGNRGDSTMRRA